MKMSDIQVSILCLTYNHENYIKRALDSFLCQETTFPFEVIVHDDASTDNTPNIIREYAEKYPDIIKPVLQKENQYSKGISVTTKCAFPATVGKYIAACEGDDYWCDNHKLQAQYEAMEKYSDCSICCHYAQCVNIETKEVISLMPNKKHGLKTGYVEKEVQLEIVLTDLFHANASFFRRDVFEDYVENMPEYSRLMPVGDAALEMYFYTHGKMYFIDKVMSVYNKGVEGSFTRRIENNNSVVDTYMDKRMNAFDCFASCLSPLEAKRIHEVIADYYVAKKINDNDKAFFDKTENKRYIREATLKQRIKYCIWSKIPIAYTMFKKVKR